MKYVENKKWLQAANLLLSCLLVHIYIGVKVIIDSIINQQLQMPHYHKGLNEGKEYVIPLTHLKKGDRMLIRNDEIIPADSILISSTVFYN